jgi:N-acetylglucosamine malate deacetylase 2
MTKLCAIFAHPDDESFSSGGTLARYADDGVEVTLVTATSGEAGDIGSAAVEPKDLGDWRERELHEAAAALGINHVRLLRLPDGHLSDLGDELRAAIVEALRDIQPEVVITEDTQGITAHHDHMAVTKAVVRAIDDLGERGPLKLYEHVLPLSKMPAGVSLRATPDDYITTFLDVEQWRERMMAALRSHRSQVGEEMLARFQSFPAPLLDHYICIRARVPILIPEFDLFAGVSTAVETPR